MKYEKIKETDTWAEYLGPKYNGRIDITRRKKYLAINGPNNGQMLTSADPESDNYTMYNTAGGRGPRTVWLYVKDL